MRWLLLLVVACGHPSDPQKEPDKSGSGTGPTRGMHTYTTSQQVCDAFPLAQIATVTKLAVDHAVPSTNDARPRCTYSQQGQPDINVVLQMHLTPSLDPIKRTFKDGHAVANLGDDSWFFHSQKNAGALYVQQGGMQIMVEVTDPGAKLFTDEAAELAMTQELARTVISKQ